MTYTEDDWERIKNCCTCYWYKPDNAGKPSSCGLFSVNCATDLKHPLWTSIREGIANLMQYDEKHKKEVTNNASK